MKKLVLSLAMVFFVLGFSVVVSAHTEDDPLIVNLIAGGGGGSGFLVGHVHVWNDADYLYVKYVVNNSDFCISETHVHVATSMSDIPQKNGNPIPGHFEYSGMHECPLLNHTYQIPISWSAGQTLYIAAHGVVQTMTGYSMDLVGFIAALPDQVSMMVTRQGFGLPSYFDVTIAGGSILDGMYDSFCLDTDHGMIQNQWLIANVFSSYETLPAGLLEYPENLDLINYIINQNYIGQPSPSGGFYTWGDIQKAIWQLVEDDPTGDWVGEWSQARVDEILADAFANGEGFVPGCNEWIAIILAPVYNQQILQILFIQVQVPCIPSYESDTAWAEGFDFPGKNWAMYFAYTIQNPN